MIDSEDIRNFLVVFLLFVFFLILFVVSYSFISGQSFDYAIRDAFAIMFGTEANESLTAFAFLFVSIVFVWLLFEYLLKIILRINFGSVRRMVKLSGSKNHYIICGYGRVGSNVALRLKDTGEKIVVVDENQESLSDCKFPYILDDALEEGVLEKAGITKAKGIICCLGKDEENVFLTITAKHINSNLKVGSRANSQKTASKLRHAGCDVIILPEVVGGFELADKMAQK